ncbi:MAG: hypothetical protein EXR05_01320 [Acetobacteraceae bacterium]|nr:hypothetical protein [Acetobacteraceae bacterium]MSP30408.1 hypothetical protein [Acetobacteraceae bacterium]
MSRLLILLVLLLPAPAWAQSRSDVASQWAGALFAESCVQHASSPTLLRAWAPGISFGPDKADQAMLSATAR